MRYVYPVNLERDGDGRFVATSPDVPEALADGPSVGEALLEMGVMLGVALAGYARQGRDIPSPSAPRAGQYTAAVAPLVAAKLALRAAMQEQGVSNVALAGRLGVSEAAVRRLVDPDHGSRLEGVVKALAALGRGLAVEDHRQDAA